MRKQIECAWGIGVVLFGLVLCVKVTPAHGNVPQEPSNRLAVIIDSSGSFKMRQAEALKQASHLLESMAQTKLHRWETDTSLITIIAMDAMPEVIWKGSLKDLKALNQKDWARRFAARTDLSSCTDVLRAFELAVRELDGDSRSVSKYLFVFSDLVHEPPTASVRECKRPTKTPPENFPWEQFADVSVTIFWVPADNKLIWQRAAKERGLEANFTLYSTSQSEVESVNPPPRPVAKISEAEQKRVRASVLEFGKGIVKWVIYAFSGIVGLAFLVLLVKRFRSRRTPLRSVRRPFIPTLRTGASSLPAAPRPIRPLAQNQVHRNPRSH